jgi:hypothetical protein
MDSANERPTEYPPLSPRDQTGRTASDNLYQELIDFQIARLKRTYTDFLADPRHQPLAKFFLEDVYTTKDKDERNRGFLSVYDHFKNKLGKDVIDNLGRLIRLNELTDELDFKMVKKFQELGIGSTFSEDEYEEAYYLCDNYDARLEQLHLIAHSVIYFHRLSHIRGIGIVLAIIRPYALIKGARVLMDFLQAGYRAFKSVDEIDEFEEAIKKRELERLNRIYSLGRRAPSIGELRNRAREMGIKGADRMTVRRLMKEMQRWA